MNIAEEKALEITTQIVVAKAANCPNNFNETGGKAAAAFFKSVYDGIKEIIEESKN